MSLLDSIFQSPQPDRVVHAGLYRLYMSVMVSQAREKQWTEDELVVHLTSLPGYLAYISELKDVIVKEISDVSDQLHDPIKSNNEKSEKE